MIERETANMALVGLFGSATALIEEIHPELVTRISANDRETAARCEALHCTALDLTNLAEAAKTIVRQSRGK